LLSFRESSSKRNLKEDFSVELDPSKLEGISASNSGGRTGWNLNQIRRLPFWDAFLFQAFFIRRMQVLYALKSQMLKTILWGGEILEDWKIKIAVLWLIYGVAVLAEAILGFLELGVIEQVIAGEVEGMQITPELLLVFAIIFLIPLVLAFLSLTLKDSINRWLNIIAGIVLAVFGLLGPVEYLAKQSAYSAYVTLFGIVLVVVAALIVWYAWKSKQKA